MSANTTRLVAEVGGFAYQADSYADDLPCWRHFGAKPELIVPYTLDTNDMRFGNATGFTEGAQFERYLTDAFDTLCAEGMAGAPKMMSVGLHCRLVGRPARFAGLKRFLDHVQRHERVWLPRRIHIARHWRAEHPPA
jgi:peptidoglycan/xylan/chitin deacetylase (PgdA/CDA1 family)